MRKKKDHVKLTIYDKQFLSWTQMTNFLIGMCMLDRKLYTYCSQETSNNNSFNDKQKVLEFGRIFIKNIFQV